MKKGFTLIELLAVIVILAVIALITTPMILGIIETAKMGAAKSSALGYLDAIEKQIVINQVDGNKEQIQDGVYDLPMEGISVKGKEPSEGWIVVGDGEVTSYSMRIMEYVVSNGSDATKDGEILEKPSLTTNFVCKRAKSLHTEVCTRTNAGCYSAGYTEEGEKKTTIIEYGNLKTDGLKSGDAFNCDVNGDGNYDEDTERFYYVTDLEENNSYAVLLYYSNTAYDSNGNLKSDNSKESGIVHYYDEKEENWHGPLTAIQNLPTVNDWTNVRLYSAIRNVKDEKGNLYVSRGNKLIENPFSYTKNGVELAARLITSQELSTACDLSIPNYKMNLSGCIYTMENTQYSGIMTNNNAYWLETPDGSGDYEAYEVYGGNGNGVQRASVNGYLSMNAFNGVRPVIEVLKTDIEI